MSLTSAQQQRVQLDVTALNRQLTEVPSTYALIEAFGGFFPLRNGDSGRLSRIQRWMQKNLDYRGSGRGKLIERKDARKAPVNRRQMLATWRVMHDQQLLGETLGSRESYTHAVILGANSHVPSKRTELTLGIIEGTRGKPPVKIDNLIVVASSAAVSPQQADKWAAIVKKTGRVDPLAVDMRKPFIKDEFDLNLATVELMFGVSLTLDGKGVLNPIDPHATWEVRRTEVSARPFKSVTALRAPTTQPGRRPNTPDGLKFMIQDSVLNIGVDSSVLGITTNIFRGFQGRDLRTHVTVPTGAITDIAGYGYADPWGPFNPATRLYGLFDRNPAGFVAEALQAANPEPYYEIVRDGVQEVLSEVNSQVALELAIAREFPQVAMLGL